MTYWMQAFSGRKIDLLAPRPEDVDIEDIAHALSMTCRYGGHSHEFYSVAEHSELVLDIAKRDTATIPSSLDAVCMLHLLLHDAPEAYLGDLLTPLKRVMRESGSPSKFDVLEARWAEAIRLKFGLPEQSALVVAHIESADRLALCYEVCQLFPTQLSEWWGEQRSKPSLQSIISFALNYWSPQQAKKSFLHRFYSLMLLRLQKLFFNDLNEFRGHDHHFTGERIP